MNYHTTTNQEILGKLVNREVLANVNVMVDFILQQDSSDAPFQYDDIENYYFYPEYYGEYANFEGGVDKQEEIERLQGLLSEEEPYTDKYTKLEEEIAELDNLESEPQEIYEWWLVTNWFGKKLKAEGEPVIDLYDQTIWGRTCTGQAILLDHVIGEIGESMEILEGQANDWSTK